MRKLAALAALTLVGIAACADGPTTPLPDAGTPSRAVARTQVGMPIPGSYIVMMRGTPGSVGAAAVDALAARHNATVFMRYSHALNGFAANMSAADAARMARDPSVAAVEPNRVVSIVATQSPVPSWGLDRIDQRNMPLDNSYTYNNTGAGVDVYIIDTGIRKTHNDFGGRATDGIDTIDGALPAQDCHGHGTHVAGTAAGSTYGVAKSANLVAVRVLDCAGFGSSASVVGGIDWVTANRSGPSVINMSLGGPPDAAIDASTRGAVSAGVTVVVAAGNSSTNACNSSPAREPLAITVGATGGTSGSTDNIAWFSNFGTCLDIFAPGVFITSAWNSSDNATAILDGTSMASPHVAGAAALYLQSNPSHSPAQVVNALTANASAGKIPNPGTGSPNLLLYTAFIGGGPPTDNPPSADFISRCPRRKCQFDSGPSSDDIGIVSRHWDWGDGTSTTNNKRFQSHTYSSAGQRTVTLTVTDTNGQTDSISKTVNVP
jgi:subtilisin family serine protease